MILVILVWVLPLRNAHEFSEITFVPSHTRSNFAIVCPCSWFRCTGEHVTVTNRFVFLILGLKFLLERATLFLQVPQACTHVFFSGRYVFLTFFRVEPFSFLYWEFLPVLENFWLLFLSRFSTERHKVGPPSND